MHNDNRHAKGYDFKLLTSSFPALTKFIKQDPNRKDSIDFGDYNAVKTLNSALLKVHYNITTVSIPDEFLIPPVPGRIDYLHHLNDLIQVKDANVLDIGTGASLIYPLLGAAAFNWHFRAVDINPMAIEVAQEQLAANPHLKGNITIEHQPDRGSIFKNIIGPEDRFTFSLCNPPFYSSEEEAKKANAQKNKNLGTPLYKRNFKGVSDELWCNGGESLFIKRMIKESALFKSQVKWFTTLVSQSNHLPKIYKQLDKLKATHRTIPMSQGQKKTRIIAWHFYD